MAGTKICRGRNPKTDETPLCWQRAVMDLGGWYSQHDKYLRITKNGCPFRKSVICKISGHRFGITYKFSDIKRTLLDLDKMAHLIQSSWVNRGESLMFDTLRGHSKLEKMALDNPTKHLCISYVNCDDISCH